MVGKFKREGYVPGPDPEGDSFMRCDVCGIEAEIDHNRTTDTLLVLYCNRCGTHGEIEKLRIRDHPVRWSGPSLRHSGHAEITGDVRLIAGRTPTGMHWLKIEGPRAEIMKKIAEDLHELANYLWGEDEDEYAS